MAGLELPPVLTLNQRCSTHFLFLQFSQRVAIHSLTSQRQHRLGHAQVLRRTRHHQPIPIPIPMASPHSFTFFFPKQSRAGQVSNHKSKSKFQSNKHQYRIVFNAVEFLSRAMSMRWIPREGGREGWRRRRAPKAGRWRGRAWNSMGRVHTRKSMVGFSA